MNRYIIKAILDSKKVDFDFSKYSRKDLEYILLIIISEYRHLKGLLDIDVYLDKNVK